MGVSGMSFRVGDYMIFALVVGLAFVIAGCTTAPAAISAPTPIAAPACGHPVTDAAAEWAANGLESKKVDAKTVTDAIKLRYGEIVAADEVSLLYKVGAPNVALIFAAQGCIFGVLLLTAGEYADLMETRPA